MDKIISITISLKYTVVLCQRSLAFLLMWCNSAFLGSGGADWVKRATCWSTLHRLWLAAKVSMVSIDEKLSALSHTWILNLVLNPYLTSLLNSRKKAVSVKGSCEGHSPARTCVHHACQWCTACLEAGSLNTGHKLVISWLVSLSFCL